MLQKQCFLICRRHFQPIIGWPAAEIIYKIATNADTIGIEIMDSSVEMQIPLDTEGHIPVVFHTEHGHVSGDRAAGEDRGDLQ
ncbi:MAG: hypothetical protein ACLR78_03585 [Roseburia sp.]